MKEKRVFALGICFDKLFWIFVLGSMIGAYYEEILVLIKAFLNHQALLWSPRRGVLYGPFSPVYGMGAVLMIYCFCKKKHTWYQTWFLGALVGGSFEYVISLLQEIFVGTRSWDYSNQWLSIGGRTTLLIMFFWGLLTVILVYLVYPKVSMLIESVPYQIGKITTYLFLTLLSFNMLISWTAILRWTLRVRSVSPVTPLGKLYDVVYPDVYMKKHFPNMGVVK